MPPLPAGLRVAFFFFRVAPPDAFTAAFILRASAGVGASWDSSLMDGVSALRIACMILAGIPCLLSLAMGVSGRMAWPGDRTRNPSFCPHRGEKSLKGDIRKHLRSLN